MTLEGDGVASTFPLPVPHSPLKKEEDFPFQGQKLASFRSTYR